MTRCFHDGWSHEPPVDGDAEAYCEEAGRRLVHHTGPAPSDGETRPLLVCGACRKPIESGEAYAWTGSDSPSGARAPTILHRGCTARP